MIIHHFLNSKSVGIIILLIAILGLFFTVGTISTRTSTSRAFQNTTQQKRLLVRNLAENLRAINVANRGARVELTLKNQYDKSITAFAVGWGRQHIATELIDTDKILAPGAVYVKTYEVPFRVVASDQGAVQERVISILVAVFDDGTSDGDSRIAGEILDTRFGKKMQINRVLSLWRTLSSTPNTALEPALASTKAAITDLPEQLHADDSFHIKAGLHSAKELALNHLEQLKNLRQRRGNVMFRQMLNEITAQYQKKRDAL